MVILCLATGLTAWNSKAVRKSSGAHPGSTGAPGEKTCSQSGCHADASVQQGNTVNTLTISDLNNGYTPGTTYKMKLQVRQSEGKLFGFQIVALDNKNGKTGSLGVNALEINRRTQLQTQGSREYLTHVANSISPFPSDGANEWEFVWTAPLHYTGPVTFYYATNVTNGDLASTGDKIYLSSYTINAAATAVEDAMHSTNAMRCEPNPASNHLSLYLPTTAEGQLVTLRFYDVAGKEIERLTPVLYNMEGLHITIPATLPAGVYLLRAETATEQWTQQIVVAP